MRCGEIKSGESKLASNHFLMCTPQLDHSEIFMELYREEKREEGDRGGQIQPVISFLSFSTVRNTQRDSQSWVEKRRRREEIEATWWRKRRVQRGREQSSQ